MPSTPLPLATTACCGIGVDGGLSREAAQASATLLKAVADPVRLRLLSAIRATDAGEACVCDLTDLVGLAQPTVSHHLKVLRDAGWIAGERRGTWIWYSIRPQAVARFRELAGAFGPAIGAPVGTSRRLPVLEARA